jgi:acyl-CoA synthetase (AMP-forming)/AMP-acid ligase II
MYACGRRGRALGRDGVAFVVLADGAAQSAAALIDGCRGSLAGYKLPKRVQFVRSLPTNATGKVARGRLRALGAG